jgi:putative thioredoxin
MLDARLVAAGHWIAALEAAPKARPRDSLQAAIGANKRDFDARFELAQLHFAKGEFTQAMDELLEILMRDKGWKDELARKTYVAILQIMTKSAPPPKDAGAPAKGALEVTGKAAVQAPSDPVVDAYRRRLSMTLF